MEAVLRAGMSEPLSSYLPEPVGRAELKQPPGEMPVYLCCCWKTHSNFCPNKRLCHARNSCEPVGAATALIFLYVSCLISGIYPMHGKTNPDGKMYKPENLDSPFLEKHGSLFSAASVCHGVCHEMMPELLKEARAALKERGRDPAPWAGAGGSRDCPREGRPPRRHFSSSDPPEDHVLHGAEPTEGNFLPLP